MYGIAVDPFEKDDVSYSMVPFTKMFTYESIDVLSVIIKNYLMDFNDYIQFSKDKIIDILNEQVIELSTKLHKEEERNLCKVRSYN